MNTDYRDPPPLRIFLSHKLVDRPTAWEIATALVSKGGGNVEVTYSAAFQQQGMDYREWIQEQLEQAQWYILAFTEAQENWDWCLYEAGYFEACQVSRNNPDYKVFCIHRGKSKPDPLKKFDSVSLHVDGALETFSERYLKQVNPNLRDNAKAMMQESNNLATQIRNSFRDKLETRHKAPHLTILVPDPSALPPTDLPDDASIEGNRQQMSLLFETNLENTKWSSLQQAPALRDRRWVTQLVHAIKDVHNDRIPQPITGNIELPDTNMNVLPVLGRVDQLQDRSYRCEIILADGITSRWAALRQPHVRALLTSIRMTIRFRYDVIDRFVGNLHFKILEMGNQRFRETLRNLLFDIMTEAEAHGLSDRKLMLDCFQDDEQHNEIASMFDDWENEVHPALCNALGMSVDNTVWTQFDQTPVTVEEEEQIEECLVRLRQINTRFLKMALARYGDFIESGEA